MPLICLLTLLFLLPHCGQPDTSDLPRVGTEKRPNDNSVVADPDTLTGGAHQVGTSRGWCQPAPKDPPVFKLTNYDIARLSIGIPAPDSINHWLAFVGLPPGNPFCAAANSAWNQYAGIWHPRSGLARHFKTRAPPGMWVDAAKVLRGQVTIPAGSVAVYERGNTIFGHVGIVTRDFSGDGSLYISANTSAPGSGGSEFSGGGVWEKEFTIKPGAAFRITGFVIYGN